ncbi:hypothetical protein ABIA39_003451 [Nocardia sp. GAS34]|uniref:bifunctional DNA primase/polymerase n=1 Tax=unclassified Nocardia TaxID=2637762 RepID=UPI003D2041CE
MLVHALDYASAGFPVLPLARRGKVPVTAHGKNDATTDPDAIRAWWSAYPLRNIGIRPPEGVLVLDVDPRAGGNLETLGPLPETWTAVTGGGGWHLWFRCPGRIRGRLGNTSGVDIKSHTGYVVVPPSIHPSGTAYTWLNHTRIQALPERLKFRAQIRFPDTTRLFRHDGVRDGEGLVGYVRRAQPGHRNQALFWAASRAYRERANQKLLDDLVAAASDIGLPHNEIHRTMRSAQQRSH